MKTLKCKMCGGELKIVPESSICECEYCGSKQTIPTTDDEKRLKLYERANKLRYENEFDKAAGVYESIVAEYQDEAEAYWGLVLCKFGIEYVDDPKTGKKIPTCHRSSFDSVMDDSDFDRVMENSDTVARALYREEAKQIEELRKGIIEVSSKEEAYDIFICYKETAEDGERTLDSVIAQDVYDALTEKGYKVFFSRITLEDKLGQEYEPYIFAALNSARVMLAFGTTYDYYNAVWVKNEWSRFLQLMAAGQKKTLIPCYKNLDAYDMPKEFAKLQAQDMGKVGALQDLLRGIDKIFGRDRKPAETTALLTATGDSNATVKRGYFALEDGEWEKAIQYFDQAMDSDPENAEIHLGLFLAKRKFIDLDSYLETQIGKLPNVVNSSVLACKPKEELIEKVVTENTVPGYFERKEIEDYFLYKLNFNSLVDGLKNEKGIYDDKDWKKAERFAKGELLTRISSAKEKHLSEIDRLIELESNKDNDNIVRISKEYNSFVEETEKKVINQRYQAEARREKDYSLLCEKTDTAKTEEECRYLISDFAKMNGYKDSTNYINICKDKIESIRKNEQEKFEEKRANLKQKIKTITMIASIVTVLIVVGIIGYKIYESKVIIPNQKYDEACALMKDQKYEEAISAFETLNGYKDSTQKIEECNNSIADLMASEEKAEQEKKQKELDEKYQAIIDKVDNGDYEGAVEDLSNIDDKDIESQIIDYIVNDLLAELDALRQSDTLKISDLHKGCLSVLDLVNTEQKDVLIEKHDKKCLMIALCQEPIIGEYADAVNHIFDMLINKEKYDEDINTLNKYSNVMLNYRANFVERYYYENDKTGVPEGFEHIQGVYYDLENHCLYIGNGYDVKLYIISGGSESIILGENIDKGTYRIKSNGDIEVLGEPVEQEAEKFFENDLD